MASGFFRSFSPTAKLWGSNLLTRGFGARNGHPRASERTNEQTNKQTNDSERQRTNDAKMTEIDNEMTEITNERKLTRRRGNFL